MGTHIERLLSDLESGSDDDRSVAHSCRVELDRLCGCEKALRELVEADTAYWAEIESGDPMRTFELYPIVAAKLALARAALPAERDEKERR